MNGKMGRREGKMGMQREMNERMNGKMKGNGKVKMNER